MLKRIIVAAASTVRAASCELGDVVHLQSGGTLETPIRLTVKIPYGIVQLFKVDVTSIEKQEHIEPAKAAPGHAAGLPALNVVFKELRKHEWSKDDVEQIPATVIDKRVKPVDHTLKSVEGPSATVEDLQSALEQMRIGAVLATGDSRRREVAAG